MANYFKQLWEQKEHEFPALTGVRFLAVSMIFLLHYSSPERFGAFFDAIFNHFYLGVHLFFVLSGFLICYIYFEKAELTRSFLSRFFIKRVARIYPLYFLVTTLFFIVYYFRGETEHWLGLYLLNISFLKGFSSWFMFTGIYPGWSLTVEETFYVLAPLIFLCIKKRNILFSQVLFFWLAGGLLLLIFSYFPFKGFFKDFHFIASATFFGRCFEFFCGIWLALFIKKRSYVNQPLQRRFPVYTYSGLGGLITVIACLSFFTEQRLQQTDQYIYATLLRSLAFPVMVTVFFYGLIRENSFIRKVLSTRLLILLGRSSYAFFLIHTGVIASWVYHYAFSIWDMYIITYILSILLFAFAEQPLRNIVNRWGTTVARKQAVA